MASHIYHGLTPDGGEVEIHEHGLQDGCPRCEEHAENPMLGLDQRMLQSLMERLSTNLPPRSNAEALAMKNLRKERTEW